MSTLKGWLQCFVHASIKILRLYGVQKTTISCCMSPKSVITEPAVAQHAPEAREPDWTAFSAILEPVNSENNAVECSVDQFTLLETHSRVTDSNVLKRFGGGAPPPPAGGGGGGGGGGEKKKKKKIKKKKKKRKKKKKKKKKK
ncbi:hypothetical protein WI827_20625, partial [Salmonella enterica subsp. enterica serovar Corvallis]